jgi:hypothetical protein
MNDVINPMEDVGQEPLKGGFSAPAIAAANIGFRTNQERNGSMQPGGNNASQNII